MDEIDYGKTLKAKMSALRLTIDDVAQGTGYKVRYLKEMLNNKYNPSQKRWDKLMTFFEMAKARQVKGVARARIVNGQIYCLSECCVERDCEHLLSCVRVKTNISALVLLSETDEQMPEKIKKGA